MHDLQSARDVLPYPMAQAATAVIGSAPPATCSLLPASSRSPRASRLTFSPSNLIDFSSDGSFAWPTPVFLPAKPGENCKKQPLKTKGMFILYPQIDYAQTKQQVIQIQRHHFFYPQIFCAFL